jgi:hypothetical protein
VRGVLLCLFLVPATIKNRKHSNQPKPITHPIQCHPSTQRERQGKKPPSRERKLLFACVCGRASHLDEFCFRHLILILMFRLTFTLVPLLALSHVLCLSLLLVLCLNLLMDPTIAHMVLVHERTALSLDALVTTHVIIVVIISRVGLIFQLEGPSPPLSQDTWTVHAFPIMVHVPLDQVVRCKGL